MMVFEIDGKLCVDGMWLQLMEEGIQERAREYRAQGDEHGAQALDRIAKSVDDVPIPLMMAYLDKNAQLREKRQFCRLPQ
jgi:hypothetical protein